MNDDLLIRAHGAAQAALGLLYTIPTRVNGDETGETYPHAEFLEAIRSDLNELIQSFETELTANHDVDVVDSHSWLLSDER